MADESRNLQEYSDIESVRFRPANIFGTNDIDGEISAIREVITNSCDEAGEGYGKLITIEIESDNTVTVTDEGRGVPMGWNEKYQKYNWEIAFCTLYGSGKYDAAQYTRSAGLNGLGLTATQFASEFMEARSIYDGVAHYMSFKAGVPVGEMREEPDNSGKTGTMIKFKPDPKVFIDADKTIPADAFNELLRRKAMTIPGLKIVLKHCDYEKPIEMVFERGAADFIDMAVSAKMIPDTLVYNGSEIGTDDDRINAEPYEAKMRISFNFSGEGGFTEMYHNGEHMFEIQKNKTLEALQKGFVSAFESFGKSEGKLEKSDKFMFRDIEQLLVCIGETECPGFRTFFKNQTKGAINNPFIVREFQSFVQRSVRSWMEQNKKVSLKVLGDVIAIKKAREEADKVSKKAIAKLTKKTTFLDKPDTLTDCESIIPEECEIYIVEGKSAAGSVVVARDDRTQAVMGLTGKPLNCVKHNNLSVIIDNTVISNLYRVLQCGVEAKSKYIKDLPPFNIKNLRYDKIIISADADVDGKHITILLLAMFYVLSPSLLKAGKVYIVESPLFELAYKDNSVFAYSDEEKDALLEEMYAKGIKQGQVSVNRSKGLGENTAEMMSMTTMSPKTRRLIQVHYPEDPKEQQMLAALFEAMLGNDIESRRIMIDQYFSITEDITD